MILLYNKTTHTDIRRKILEENIHIYWILSQEKARITSLGLLPTPETGSVPVTKKEGVKT